MNHERTHPEVGTLHGLRLHSGGQRVVLRQVAVCSCEQLASEQQQAKVSFMIGSVLPHASTCLHACRACQPLL